MRNLKKLFMNLEKLERFNSSQPIVGWRFGDVMSVIFSNGEVIEHNPYKENTYYDDY